MDDGVRLTAGKWPGSKAMGGTTPLLELALLLGKGLELVLKPASMGSGRTRGDTWTLWFDEEGGTEARGNGRPFV